MTINDAEITALGKQKDIRKNYLQMKPCRNKQIASYKSRAIPLFGIALLLPLLALIEPATFSSPILPRNQDPEYRTSEHDPLKYRQFHPRGNYFTLLLPASWSVTENDLTETEEYYLMQAYAPGDKTQHFTLFEIIWFADLHKTPEKYLFDLLNTPTLPGDKRSTPRSITIAEREALTLRIETKRIPVANEELSPVRNRKDYFIVPVKEGFFVLLSDVPVDHPDYCDQMLQKIMDSFNPNPLQTTLSPIAPEITPIEYEIFNSFFSAAASEYNTLPAFIPGALLSGKILGSTSPASGLTRIELTNLQKTFGRQFLPLYRSYLENNRIEYRIKDRIMVTGLSIFSKKQHDRIKAGQLLGSLTGLNGEYISLSRPGFNETHDQALFHLSWSGSLMANCFVLMEKSGADWQIVATALDDRMMYKH